MSGRRVTPFIEQAFEQNKVDRFLINEDDIKRHYQNPDKKGEGYRVLVEDVHKEVSDWSYFRNKPRFIDPFKATDSFAFDDYEPPARTSPTLFHSEPEKPYVRKEVKVGRNDPCSCGSGKKYKKCCLFK